jgi:predicted phosphoadenosine phosphosulfate sulfurtransferase
MSGPSGKDSGVMMHLVCQEARKRGRKIGVLYVDLEAQYELTIANIREMFALYKDVIDPHWVAIPLRLRNAVSMEQPYWVCWDPECPESWVRKPPPEACTDTSKYPFHIAPQPSVPGEARVAMEFEEFIEEFGHWYAQGEPCACLVGIRSDESLNRWRAVTQQRKSRLEGKPWTAWKGQSLYNVYPIYDWKTQDIWTYYGKEGMIYNHLYDMMWKAGLSIHQQRICQPYGDDQRRGLAMYHVIEPETWARVVARVSGANSGALYAGKKGNILGNGKVTLPKGHTWKSFARFLLDSLPESERDSYENKIAVFLKWWENHGIPVIPDDTDPILAEKFPRHKGPSWMRICKCILKNDRMCRSLSFSQHVSGGYEQYSKLMKKRRAQWGLI